MKRLLSAALLTLLAFPPLLAEPDLDFLETFALPEKRAAALQQLVPGSEYYYIYHCLHFQLTGDEAQYRKFLGDYRKRYNRTPGVKLLENRQALLTFEQNPKATYDYLRRELNLHFNHEREALDEASTAPSTLDPAVVDGDRKVDEMLANDPNGLGRFTPQGLLQLAGKKLTPNQRRHLLELLDKPDFPGLVERVVENLKEENSGGFGARKVHRVLTLAQLDAVAEAWPPARQSEAWVEARLARLRPDDDVDMAHDRAARREFLIRARAFAETLEPKFNTLRVSLLRELLALDQAEGRYDAELFLAYARLPRQSNLMLRSYRESAPSHAVALINDARYAPAGIPPMGDDEPLVRDILEHLLLNAPNWDPYAPYFEEWFLKEVYATANLLAGAGDTERLTSMMDPTRLKQLRERVDIQLLPTNPDRWRTGDAVKLDLAVKNVPELLVKVFAVNSAAVCRETLENPEISLDLDGLVATREFKLASKEPPMRRMRRVIELPDCKGPGVWIVEMIGNGKSSRALVRKGRLIALPGTTPSGQEFRILDEERQLVKDAALRLGGQLYAADKEGVILVPFSTAPGPVKAVIERGDFAEVFTFEHEAETIHFNAGFHLEREQLLPGGSATLLVRPSLRVNGMPVGLKDLEDITLVLASTNLRGVTSRDEVKIPALETGAEFAHTFRVPDQLRHLQASLTARIQPLNRREKQELADSTSFPLNGLRTQAQTEAVNFGSAAGRWFLDLRGLNGETRAGRPVQFVFRHRWSQDELHATLSTDARGRIDLGPLTDIVSLTASAPGGISRTWSPSEDRTTLPARLQCGPDGVVGLALPDHSTLALYSLRGGAYLAEESDKLKADGNVVVIAGLAPGDYQLFVRPQHQAVPLRVTRGVEVAGHLVTAHAALKVTEHVPLALAAPAAQDGELVIPVRNASGNTRVHVIASRFQPAFDAFDRLAWNVFPGPVHFNLGALGNQYASGRAIGDEVRYVLDRRDAERVAGVLLPKPGLILNPWERRSTSADREVLAEGEKMMRQLQDAAVMDGKRADAQLRRGADGAAVAQAQHDFLDFLARGSVVLPNLKPDAQGRVRVKLADLQGLPMLTVVAVDPRGGMSRSFSAGDTDVALRDLRLRKILDASRALTEMKLISPLLPGAALKLDASQDADMQVFDRLPQVFDYFLSLRPDDTLAEFKPLTRWPEMKEEEKLEFYGRHACHELHFFLYHKDRAFFDAVVKPYLANKRDKTFLDLFLLDADLSGFTEPWRFHRLHTVEQVLLSRRLKDRAPMTARLLADKLELTPPDRTVWSLWFDTGLAQNALGDRNGDMSDPFADGTVSNTTEALAVAAGEPMMLKNEVFFNSLGRAGGFGGAGAPPPASAPAPAAAKPAARMAMAKEMAVMEDSDAANGRAEKKSLAMDKAKEQLSSRLEERSRQTEELRERRKLAEAPRQLYRKPEATKEWAENNYWKRLPGQQLADMVNANRFWLDYARAEAGRPFLSSNLAEANTSFAEAMLALAVLDLPFAAGKHDVKREGDLVTFTAGGPCIVFHKEIREAGVDANLQPVVMAQKFFDHHDRTRLVEGQQVDRYLREGFVKGRILGGRVIVTNPTALPRRLDVLVQIPRGAIPVNNGYLTREHAVDVPAFGTQQIEYLFYFPQAGTYEAFPAMASEKDAIAARAEAMTFLVLEKPAGIDEASWDFVSQRGDNAAVLTYLAGRNLLDIDLGRIAWRMKDKAFFAEAVAALRGRQVYHDTLWSYGVAHADAAATREWLAHQGFAGQCGDWIRAPLLAFDPVERITYEHLEYAPLVNPRAHPVGGKRTILNEVFRGQYTRLVRQLGYKPELSSEDRLGLAYYLLLQDRLSDAAAQMARVKPAEVAEQLQLAYLNGWMALARGDAAAARAAVQPHGRHPVPRWRKIFGDALAQIDEIEGKAAATAGADREGNEAEAASEPVLELKAEGATLVARHRRIGAFTLNFYPMDVELLFSKRPFMQEVGGQFSFIAPVRSEVVKTGQDPELRLPLPAEFKGRNVLVEAVAGGLRRTAPVFAGDLAVELIENYGQVRVADAANKPLPKAYVKVYGRRADGSVVFYKDGYTDLRGRFDYASLNSDDLNDVERFALLILDDTHGAAIREATPPKR